MAAGDIRLATSGTTKTWTSSGGDYAMTMSSIATTNGRAGAKGDLEATRAEEWVFFAQIKAGATGPTAGTTYDFYWVASRSGTAGTDNAGRDGLFTGVDVALTAPSANELGPLMFIGAIPLTNTNNGIFRRYWTFRPQNRYGFPVFVNKSGQTTGTTGTDHIIQLIPREFNVEQ